MRIFIIIIITLTMACSHEGDSIDTPVPPVAPMQQKILQHHGYDRLDEYYWIRDDFRQNEQVLKLLESENAYTNAVMKHTTELQQSLMHELSSRLPSVKKSVPIRRDGYLYFQEFLEDGQYPVYKRTLIDSLGETTLLDSNELSNGKIFYKIGNFSVSQDHKLLAFAEDEVSRGVFRIRIKNISENKYLADEILGVSSALAWASDNQTLFYVKKHPQTLLPYQVYRHKIEGGADNLVYEEIDKAFYTSIYLTRSKKYIAISNSSTDSSEILLVDAKDPTTSPKIFLKREVGHEYRIRHHDDYFYVLTNWNARNYRLMRVQANKIGTRQYWEEIIEHRNMVLIEDFEIFDDYLVLAERYQGLTRFRVINQNTSAERFISFSEPTYSAKIHANPNSQSTSLRYSYSSLTTPTSIFEYDLHTGESNLLQVDNIFGDFNDSNYRSERIVFKARDGIEVPISLVYRKDKFTSGYNAGYLHAYGAYGYSSQAAFQSRRLSLLDRGFVIAIIHVRGGEEMGRYWYDEGRLLRKKNTFNDFVDGTRALVKRRYINPEKVFAAGASAGGLLMGVVANEAPELYRGIIARVPFVDLVTTMLDESIPLTSGEYSEWGDPNQKRYFDYMLSYSPYDQVKAQMYPNMLVTTGLHDSRVQYFEPVKWVSRLRRLKRDKNLLLLHIDMNTGHHGASDNYFSFRRDALEYAFILDVLGKR
ncbi:MAG: S9 family peptidase [Candidatus Azotimanducaceae bacterium]|uniref:S9 family peptidase n=1 Tax=OM182 bacterium TaxID=2510334 RepID=A0A520RZ92_9GAMM|nr:MAG: S9 family peptidase [OM182 bacterium]